MALAEAARRQGAPGLSNVGFEVSLCCVFSAFESPPEYFYCSREENISAATASTRLTTMIVPESTWQSDLFMIRSVNMFKILFLWLLPTNASRTYRGILRGIPCLKLNVETTPPTVPGGS